MVVRYIIVSITCCRKANSSSYKKIITEHVKMTDFLEKDDLDYDKKMQNADNGRLGIVENITGDLKRNKILVFEDTWLKSRIRGKSKYQSTSIYDLRVSKRIECHDTLLSP